MIACRELYHSHFWIVRFSPLVTVLHSKSIPESAFQEKLAEIDAKHLKVKYFQKVMKSQGSTHVSAQFLSLRKAKKRLLIFKKDAEEGLGLSDHLELAAGEPVARFFY